MVYFEHFIPLDGWSTLNPNVDTPLFATNANPLQLCHSPRSKIMAFRVSSIVRDRSKYSHTQTPEEDKVTICNHKADNSLYTCPDILSNDLEV